MEILIVPTQDGFVLQLKTFASKIGTYEIPLGLAHAKVLSIQADALYCDYILEAADAFDTYSQGMNKYKDILLGRIRNETLGALPTIPVLAAAPPAVAGDVRKRFSDLIADCKRSPNFNEAIAEDLGILAPENPSDPDTAKPVITKFNALPDGIKIDFKKQGWFGVMGYVSNDGVNWTKGEKDLQSPYEDRRQNKSLNVPETRYFRFRFLNSKGEEVGLPSEPMKIVAEIYPTTASTI